jgi:acetyltransferase-like isoleucine patch superfamily enzyme
MRKEVRLRVHHDLHSGQKSSFRKYCDLVVGRNDFFSLFKFELITFFCSGLPGALGLFLRSKLYPFLFKKCGKGVIFGKDLTLRHPHKIEIGKQVVIDDHCLLDAKGVDNRGIRIGDKTFLGRNTILSCKNGDILLGKNVNIGFNCYIFSGSEVSLADNVLMAAYCYLIGGDHDMTDSKEAVASQGSSSYGIRVGENAWLGAGVKVQDKTEIGAFSIVGTGAVVTKDIPEYSVAVGIPAKVVKQRPKPEGGAS